MADRTPRQLKSGARRAGVTVPEYLESVLDAADSVEAAAIQLGVTVSTIYRWKRAYPREVTA